MSSADRLGGNLIQALGGDWLEERASRNAARRRARETVSDALIERMKQKVEGGELAAAEHLSKMLLSDYSRKQENVDEILYLTYQDLSEKTTVDASSPDKEVDPDWLNLFSSLSENASSDHLQALWAKILAGKIRKPKTFSLTTLRLMSELDQEIAGQLQKVVMHSSTDGNVPKQSRRDGQTTIDHIFLEEHGLISEAFGSLSIRLDKQPDGSGVWRDGDYILRVRPVRDGVSFPVFRLTRAGREIRSILPANDPRAYLRAAFEYIEGTVHDAELSKIVRSEGDAHYIDEKEVLKGIAIDEE